MITEKYKILIAVSERFLKSGFRKVSMEDLAKEMRISKKTFYKHFSSKTEIIENIVYGIRLNFNRSLYKATKNIESPVQKMSRIGDVVIDLRDRVSIKWQGDLKNNHPNLWKEFESYRISELDNAVVNVINDGIKEGLFIDTNPKLFSSMVYSSLRDVSFHDFVENESRNCMNILIRGILTLKGKNEFDAKNKIS